MKDAFTVTFGDRAENHAGMQMIGRAASKGVSTEQLRAIKARLDALAIPCAMVDLSQLVKDGSKVPEACVLVIPGGVAALLKDPAASDEMLAELRSMPKDTKMYDRGKVKTRHSCHNNTMGDFDQAADIANKKGTVCNFKDYPTMDWLRRELTSLLGMSVPLVGELNHYYDADKCGIGWHGIAAPAPRPPTPPPPPPRSPRLRWRAPTPRPPRRRTAPEVSVVQEEQSHRRRRACPAQRRRHLYRLREGSRHRLEETQGGHRCWLRGIIIVLHQLLHDPTLARPRRRHSRQGP